MKMRKTERQGQGHTGIDFIRDDEDVGRHAFCRLILEPNSIEWTALDAVRDVCDKTRGEIEAESHVKDHL